MRLWYLLVPAIAMGSLNAGYSAWRASPPSKLTEFRAMCFGKVEAAGLSRSESIPLCNCLIGKARWYKWTHFGADYTRDVHMSLGRECIAEMTPRRRTRLRLEHLRQRTTPQPPAHRPRLRLGRSAR